MKKPKHNGLNFGLVHEERLGGFTDIYKFPKIIDGANGWFKYSTEKEIQKSKTDDFMDCTLEAPSNGFHMFLDFFGGWGVQKNGEKLFPTENLAQRFNAEDSGVTRSGNTTDNADYSIKNRGVCDEIFWPRNSDMTWEQYYSAIPSPVYQQAKKSLEFFEYNTYVIKKDHQTMMAALDRGILLVTGYAWAKGDDGLYYDFGYDPNHRFVIAGYEIGREWKVIDSYPTDFLIDNNSTQQEFYKDLDWNFNFGEVKLLIIKPKATSKKKAFSILFNKSMTELQAYMDDQGLHVWYIDKRGKQEIPLTTMFEKAWAMGCVKNGAIKTTTYPAIANLPNYKFF